MADDVQIGEPEIDEPTETVTAPAPAAPDPVASQFTWENASADTPAGDTSAAPAWNPGQWNDSIDHSQSGTDLEMPDAGSASAAYPAKASASGKGITDRGIAQTQKLHGFSDTDTQTDAQMAPLKAQQDQLRAGYAKVNDLQHEAIGDQIQAEKDHFARTQDLNRRVADFQDTSRAVEEAALAHTQADRQQYMTQYQSQLGAVRQLMAQDANPLHNMSGGAKMALGAAQFAQGFLAARGVQIDVSGQVDKWVSRELEQHQQAIKNARDVAGDTLTLYGIARQASSDDAEARQKLRGFVIEGLKARLQVEGDRYQSDLAGAAAKGKIADLDREQIANTERLGNAYFDTRMKVRQGIVQEHHDQGMLALEQAKVGLEAERISMAKKSAQAAYVPISNPGNVKYDPKTKKPITGDRFDWMVDPKNETAYKESMKARSGYADIQSGIQHMKDLKSRLDKDYGPKWYKERSSEAYRLWNAERGLQVATIQRGLTGLQANEKETEFFNSLMPDDQLLQAGNTNKNLDVVQRWGREHFEHAMDTYAVKRPLAGDDSDYDAVRTADPVGKAENDAAIDSRRIAPMVDAEAAKVVSTKPTPHDQGTASPAYVQYLQESGEKDVATHLNDYPQGGHLRAIDFLAHIALDPKTYAEQGDHVDGQPVQSPDELRADAVKALQSTAAGSVSGKDVDPDSQKYAQYVLHKVSNTLDNGWGGNPKQDKETLDSFALTQHYEPTDTNEQERTNERRLTTVKRFH